MTPYEKAREILEKARLMDDIFMACIFEDIPCTQYLLDVILAPKKVFVKSVEVHHEIKSPSEQAVSLDVYAEDADGRQYDIEVQRDSRGATGNRAMFYSSMLQTAAQHRSKDYSDVPETYVIFITENDVYHTGRPILHFHERADEDGTPLGDNENIIFVNGEYRNEDDAIGRLMHDFRCRKPDEMHPSPLQKKTKRIKESEKEVNIMCKLWEDAIKEMREEGMAEGKAEGRTEGAAQEKIDNAKALLKAKIATPEKLAEVLGMPLEQLKQLAAEVQ